MSASLILVDSHVHFHGCFRVEEVLSKAYKNFSLAATSLGSGSTFFSCLFLTEMRGETWFLDRSAQIQQHSQGLPLGNDWALNSTSEPVSLVASNNTGKRIFIFAGRQIVTSEGLEVLALLTPNLFEDGLPLQETLTAVAAAGGLPVLPWGAGKWIGRRGQLVANLLQQNPTQAVYLGDNSGRPLGWRRPHNFALADEKGIPVLPGTDPLPISKEVSRIGTFGFALSGDLDENHPGEYLLKALKSHQIPLSPYGSLEKPWRFLANQLSLRLAKA